MRMKKATDYFKSVIKANPRVTLTGYVIRHQNCKSYYVTNSAIIDGVSVHFGVLWKIPYDCHSSGYTKNRMQPQPEIVLFTADQVRYMYTPEFSGVPQLMTEKSPKPVYIRVSDTFRRFCFSDREDFIERFWNKNPMERREYIRNIFVEIAKNRKL